VLLLLLLRTLLLRTLLLRTLLMLMLLLLRTLLRTLLLLMLLPPPLPPPPPPPPRPRGVRARTRAQAYGEPFAAGDVIGCLISLPEGPATPLPGARVLDVGSRYHCPFWVSYWLPPPTPCPGGERPPAIVRRKRARCVRGGGAGRLTGAGAAGTMAFFKNGRPQGVAFAALWSGVRFPPARPLSFNDSVSFVPFEYFVKTSPYRSACRRPPPTCI
jgi:hypothetical protein